MSREEKKEAPLARPGSESSSFDRLPVEGWFWELVRRDKRFRERFEEIDQAAQAYAAARLSPDEYARRLKNYLAHLRRYGVQPFGLASSQVQSRRIKTGCYLLLPAPGKDKFFAVPRPETAYLDFGKGLKPAPRKMAPPKSAFSRGQIRKLLAKHGLIEKREPPEDAAAAQSGSNPDISPV